MKLIRPISRTSSEDTSSAPRSDQVRQRRSSVSQARVQTAVKQATNPVTRRSVPVTPGFRAQPVMRRTASKARRKFSISLGADGAQLVLPAMPIVRPTWKSFSALLVVAFLAAIFYLTSSDTFRVDTLTVNGAERIQPADIMAVMDIDGSPVYALDADELTKRLRQDFPEFSSIQLSIGLPNQVTLDVVERQPVFEWRYTPSGATSETTLWVDLEGAVFLERGVATAAVTVYANMPPPMVMLEGAPIDLEEQEKTASGIKLVVVAESYPGIIISEHPLASMGNQSLPYYHPDVRRADMDVMMAAARLTLRKPEGSDLVYDGYEGFGWHDPRGWDVYFGTDLNDMEFKFDMYQAILGQLAQEGIQPYLISVAHVHAPFYRAHNPGSVEQ